MSYVEVGELWDLLFYEGGGWVDVFSCKEGQGIESGWKLYCICSMDGEELGRFFLRRKVGSF